MRVLSTDWFRWIMLISCDSESWMFMMFCCAITRCVCGTAYFSWIEEFSRILPF